MTDPRLQKEYDVPGFYRAVPLYWKVEPPSNKPDEKTGQPSQSVPIAIQFGIRNQWVKNQPTQENPRAEGGQWSQDYPEGYFCYSRTYIVGRDGQPSQAGVEQLTKSGLWGGDFGELEGPPREVVVIIELVEDNYNGKMRVKCNWIQPNADVPVERAGAFTPSTPETLQYMRQRFGGSFRAIAGAKPGGQPPAPPAAAPKPNGPPTGQVKPAVQQQLPGTARPPMPGAVKPLPPPGPQPLRPPAPTPVAAPAAPAGFGEAVEDPNRVPWDTQQ